MKAFSGISLEKAFFIDPSIDLSRMRISFELWNQFCETKGSGMILTGETE